MLLSFTILLEDYWAFFIPKSPFLRLSVIFFDWSSKTDIHFQNSI